MQRLLLQPHAAFPRVRDNEPRFRTATARRLGSGSGFCDAGQMTKPLPNSDDGQAGAGPCRIARMVKSIRTSASGKVTKSPSRSGCVTRSASWGRQSSIWRQSRNDIIRGLKAVSRFR